MWTLCVCMRERKLPTQLPIKDRQIGREGEGERIRGNAAKKEIENR